jgi:hypothetical protein
MHRRRGAALAFVAAVLLGACDGGDATPTAPAGNGVPADPNTADDPGQLDPGDELEEPDPDEPPPDTEDEPAA